MCLIKIGDLTKKIVKKEKKTICNTDEIIDKIFENTNIGGSFKRQLYDGIKLQRKFNKLIKY